MIENLPELADLGQRICILGRSNSGKSTLAQALSHALDIPCFHLDQHAHIENTAWVPKDGELFAQEHLAMVAQDAWIIDGNYSRVMPERLKRATAVIWLDLPLGGCLFRYLMRCVKRDKQAVRAGGLEGATNEFSFGMMYHMFVNYSKNRSVYRGLLAQHLTPECPVVSLRSLAALNVFYQKLSLVRD